MGLDENSSVQIIEITKIFLVDIWEKREKDITARALTVVWLGKEKGNSLKWYMFVEDINKPSSVG